MRRQLRRVVTTIASVLVFVVLYPVVSEFFIELAREANLYDEPSQRLRTLMTAFNSFVGQAWFTHLAIFFVGCAIGLWMDHVIRERGMPASLRWPFGRRQASVQLQPTASMTNAAPQSAPASRLDLLAGMTKSDSKNFDLIPVDDLVLRGTRTRDGIDILAILPYRNRGTSPLGLKLIAQVFNIDGKLPSGRASSGISSSIPPSKTMALQFNIVRIYKEETVSGQAMMMVGLGKQSEPVRNVMKLCYTFKLVAYPDSPGIRTELQSETVEKTVEYYVTTTS